jgi:cysteinyl-tRNA synthetase
MRFFNTLSQKKEIFKPKKDKKVNLFVCGPTVYDYPHIGHARVYIVFDSMVKFLSFLGYKIFFLMNITDVDDKIINRAKEEKVSPFEIAKRYEKIFFEDLKSLKINSINKFARASNYISKIIQQIKKLMNKSFAYVAKDGSVYFRTRKFKEYGKLSHQKLDNLKSFETGFDKEDPLDFALWKAKKDPYEPSWKAPWSEGRPGWHIEDTAITETFFGEQYDIHGGGLDLIFPHHECEIAQQEAASRKKPFVKYWLHVGLLLVNGEKMSKSLGNFITIRDFINKETPRFLRYFILYHHYRSPIDYNEKTLESIKRDYFLLNEKIAKLTQIKCRGKKSFSPKKIKDIQKKILKPLEDDFNTHLALANLNSFLNEIEPLIENNDLDFNSQKLIINKLKEIDKIFSVIFPWKNLDKEEKELIKKREKYRLLKEYQKADEIRDFLAKKSIILEDRPKRVLVIILR